MRYAHAGLTFDVADRGPRDGGPVVLLHGFPQDASSWDAVTPLLHAAGMRTLVPNLRGYAPDAAPRASTAYTLDHLVGDVVALLDAAELAQVCLVGHDWGGAVAWAVAAQHPERLSALVVLSTPHPAAMGWAIRHSTQGLRSWYMLAFQLPWLPERILSRLLRRRSGGRFADPESLRGPLNYYRALRHGGRAGLDRPIEVPTTYLWGRHDHFLGRAAAERTARHVRADYRFVELDADHWLPEEHAPEVAAAVLASQNRFRSP